MAANIDTMLYVGEKPWHQLGAQYTSADLTCTEDIIKGAQMDWTVGIEKMKGRWFRRYSKLSRSLQRR